MTIYLVRHVKAGDRSNWDGDDVLRPLSKRGERQADRLAEQLRDAEFARIVSSPYVRCMESVVPLASMRGVAVEPHAALEEGGDLESVLTLVKECAPGGAVLCSHGDIIPMFLEDCARNGVDLGPDPRTPKGSTWILETRFDGTVKSARYVEPPPD